MKPAILFLISFGPFLALCGQEMPANSPQNPKAKNEARIAYLLSQARLKRPNPGDTSEQFSVAVAYVDEAIRLSSEQRLHKELYKASIEKLDILLNAGKISQMEQMLSRATDSSKAEAARYISRFYNDAIFVPRNYPKAIDYASLSLAISQSLNDRNRQISSNNQLGYIYMFQGNYDEAEKYFTAAVDLGKPVNSPNLSFAYAHLVAICDRKGYMNSAVRYGLDALRHLEKSGFDRYAMGIYGILGRVYTSLGEFENGRVFFDKALKEAGKNYDENAYWFYMTGRTNLFIKMGESAEALEFIDRTMLSHPPRGVLARVYAATMKGKVYVALADFEKAQKHLFEAEQLNTEPGLVASINKSLADLFFAKGDFEKSKEHLEKVVKNPKVWTLSNIAAAHLLGFRIDSARGDLQSAILHLQKHKQFTDSVNALSNVGQIEELKLQYKTEKITQDITLKQQTILLLENKQQLQAREFEESRLKFLIESKDKENNLLSLNAEAAEKDKNILLSKQNITKLENDNASRKARLENANLIRNITFGFVFLLAVVIVLLYRQFRSKQASSKIIGIKNDELQRLVKEKEGLLEEKDWLLKEVHHRVKNNLQTVVSLLESQSVYLDSKALEANQDSRNRVYAMSLVHQKLYQTENVAAIQMDTYLGELVEHLRDSLDVKSIYFKLALTPCMLDVSQAISLGLVLNESITNSIKYAFPGSQTDRIIEVSLFIEEDGGLCLTMRDNGIGLPPDIATGKPSSLGLKLMKGLTREINGNFDIRSENGTVVIVRFLPETTLPSLNKKQRV